MRRGREIVGRSVVSADRGRKLGSAADLLIDDRAHRLVGIVVRQGWLRRERVLPYTDVQALGDDTVIVRANGGMLDRRGWRQQGTRAMRVSRLKGKPVVTAAGRSLGAVRDILVDERNGAIDGYELAARTGLLAPRSMLPRIGDVTIGPDAIVVPEDDHERGARR